MSTTQEFTIPAFTIVGGMTVNADTIVLLDKQEPPTPSDPTPIMVIFTVDGLPGRHTEWIGLAAYAELKPYEGLSREEARRLAERRHLAELNREADALG